MNVRCVLVKEDVGGGVDDRYVDATELVVLLKELYEDDRQETAADAVDVSRGQVSKWWSAVRRGERIEVRRSTVPGLRRAVEIRAGGREEYRKGLSLAIQKVRALLEDLESIVPPESPAGQVDLVQRAARAVEAIERREAGDG